MQDRCADRRAANSTFHYPERRTGFDRRRLSDPVRVLRERPAALLALLLVLNLLSLADLLLTSRAMSYGAIEANMLMGSLFGTSLAAATGFKVAAMLAVSVLIWVSRRYRLVLLTAVGAVAVYALLMVYHLSGLAAIGGL